MLNTFYYQLTHTTLKNVELLKHSKINKNAPTCFDWFHVEHFLLPTDAHNVKKRRAIKAF